MNHKLKVENLHVSYGNKLIIKDINIFVDKGELVSIIGVSGSGKTTLFNAIAGIISPTKGDIFLNGENITNTSGKLSYMLQKDLLFPFKKIKDNIILPLILKGIKKEEAYSKMNEYIDEFGIKELIEKYPNELSGGQRQRAALLRTYLFSSDMSLLDEPFSALDQITKTNLHKWYIKIKRELNLSTLFITHDIDEAIILSDRIYILSIDENNVGYISKEIKVDLEKKDNLSLEFLNLKREIIKYLNK